MIAVNIKQDRLHTLYLIFGYDPVIKEYIGCVFIEQQLSGQVFNTGYRFSYNKVIHMIAQCKRYDDLIVAFKKKRQFS